MEEDGRQGPSFAVTNNRQVVIVYGKIAVYFYDKAGKQLDVQDDSGTPPRRSRTTRAPANSSAA